MDPSANSRRAESVRRRRSAPETIPETSSKSIAGTISVRIFAILGAAALMILMILSSLAAFATSAPVGHNAGIVIQGAVFDAQGRPVEGAVVRLRREGEAAAEETKSDPAGAYAFSALQPGRYRVSAEHAGLRSAEAEVVAAPVQVPEPDNQVDQVNRVNLVLSLSATPAAESGSKSGSKTPPASQAMQFADQPDFTIAGVTDWTAVGGHGSDSILRTSEDLARETAALEAKDSRPGAAASTAAAPGESESSLRAALAGSPGSFAANHRLGAFYLRSGRYAESAPLLQAAYRIDPANRGNELDLALACQGAGDLPQAREHLQNLLAHEENASLHRLLGDIDEKLGDPLAAVREYEHAARLDPSERNYFAWGSELLLHRAVWQAVEVFRNGAKAYPNSAQMLSALGAALFAGALYDEAAQRLCAASDLHPADPEPYLFLGKIETAAPAPLPCVEQRLARFAGLQPENAVAAYLYAMAILKQQNGPAAGPQAQRAESLLRKAVTLDPQCSGAYLQLGILAFAHNRVDQAIDDYSRAIAADPNLSDAHYRLGVAYERTGQPAKAKEEFQIHDRIARQQAEAVEGQRREIKQFLVVLEGQPNPPESR